jgi:hypothetical protein
MQYTPAQPIPVQLMVGPLAPLLTLTKRNIELSLFFFSLIFFQMSYFTCSKFSNKIEEVRRRK